MIRCLVNGSDTLKLSAADRGLHYGDGLFETIYVADCKPRHWQQHIHRLSAGCDRLGLVTPDPEVLFDEIARVSITEGHCVVKIIVTRGLGNRGYRYDDINESTRIVARYDLPEYPASNFQEGVRLKVCDTRISIQPALAGIKHLNRLENVLARNEWQDDTYAEGLMLDTNDNVIEGTMSNLFWVEGDRLYTPKLEQCGIHGIMRQRVMETAAEMGVDCDEVTAGLDRVEAADELFVTNSIIGIWPASFSASPVRGEITAMLMQHLAESDGILFI